SAARTYGCVSRFPTLSNRTPPVEDGLAATSIRLTDYDSQHAGPKKASSLSANASILGRVSTGRNLRASIPNPVGCSAVISSRPLARCTRTFGLEPQPLSQVRALSPCTPSPGGGRIVPT